MEGEEGRGDEEEWKERERGGKGDVKNIGYDSGRRGKIKGEEKEMVRKGDRVKKKRGKSEEGKKGEGDGDRDRIDRGIDKDRYPKHSKMLTTKTFGSKL